jgi:hypothetical protein
MNKRDFDRDDSGINVLKMPGAAETLLTVMTEGGVTPAALLECLHYASDEGLFQIMRTVAALDVAERAKVIECAQALQGEDLALRLLLQMPGPADQGREAHAGQLDAVSGERG